MSDPNERDGMSVTLKSDGRDGTWIVFHGSPARIREQITETFQMENQEDVPLFDLINEATRVYKATGNVSSALGGRVIGGKGADTTSGKGSAWDRAKSGNGGDTPAEPEEDPNVVRLTAEIEDVADVAALKELYARNKAHFDAHDELMAAYKAKGKSLSS